MIDPFLLVKWQQFIMQGKRPLWLDDNSDVIEDPSPNGQMPTLQDQFRAHAWLADRGWGMAPQAVQVNMELKSLVAPELPRELIEANPHALALIARGLEMAMLPPAPDPNIVDAELVEDVLQEPSQVAEGDTKTELQELSPSDGANKP